MSTNIKNRDSLFQGLLKLILVFIVIFFAETAIWVFLFSTPILKGTIFFYRGLILLVLSLAITCLTMVSIRGIFGPAKRKAFDGIFSLEKNLSAFVACSSVCVSFFVVVPVTIERSVTTFMLGKMEKLGALSPDQIRNLLSVDYVDGTSAVSRRTSEQIFSGNLRLIEGGRYELTENAKTFLRFSEKVASLFGVVPSYMVTKESNP